MFVIRTAEEMACALTSPLDPTLRERLAAQRDHLLNYPEHAFEELGVFIVIQPGDSLNDISRTAAYCLADGESFSIEAEAIDQHGGWLELLFILSDDGFGLVLFVPLQQGTDPGILKACQALAPNRDLLNTP